MTFHFQDSLYETQSVQILNHRIVPVSHYTRIKIINQTISPCSVVDQFISRVTEHDYAVVVDVVVVAVVNR